MARALPVFLAYLLAAARGANAVEHFLTFPVDRIDYAEVDSVTAERWRRKSRRAELILLDQFELLGRRSIHPGRATLVRDLDMSTGNHWRCTDRPA